MYYPTERQKYRVLDTLEGSVLWAGYNRVAASENFENAVSSLTAAGIKTYVILQELDERGLYRRVKERVI